MCALGARCELGGHLLDASEDGVLVAAREGKGEVEGVVEALFGSLADEEFEVVEAVAEACGPVVGVGLGYLVVVDGECYGPALVGGEGGCHVVDEGGGDADEGAELLGDGDGGGVVLRYEVAVDVADVAEAVVGCEPIEVCGVLTYGVFGGVGVVELDVTHLVAESLDVVEAAEGDAPVGSHGGDFGEEVEEDVAGRLACIGCDEGGDHDLL